MASFGNDTYTDVAATDLLTHVPDSGSTWKAITGVTGHFQINSAGTRIRVTTAATNTGAYLNTTPPSADYDVEADLVLVTAPSATSYHMGVIGRAQSTSATFYLFRYIGSGVFQLYRFNSGTATLLGSYTPGTALAVGSTTHLTLRMRGAVISGLVNGVSQISVTDSSPINLAYFSGVYGSQNIANDTTGYQLDNFTATDAASVTPTAPVNTVAPVASGTASVGSVLSVTNGTWTGNPTPTYTYQWQRGGTNISGATGSTYTVTSADVGTTLTCVVTGTNTNGNASATSNGIAIPAAPVNTVAPVVTTDGTPATGETISVDNGTWTGSGISYTYQWYRGSSPISGATSNTYTLTVTDEGASISCRVTATNGGGSATANSNSITPAVTAPISDASFLTYLSGGSGNSDPSASIGGARGATYSAGLNGLVGPVLGSVAQAGAVFYRVVYVRNTHATATAAGLKLFIETQFASGTNLEVAVAVPTEGVNTSVAALASGTTAPTGVTWITTTDPASGAAFGDLGPGNYRGVYVRFTVTAGAPLTSEADATFAVDGTAA